MAEKVTCTAVMYLCVLGGEPLTEEGRKLLAEHRARCGCYVHASKTADLGLISLDDPTMRKMAYRALRKIFGPCQFEPK